MIFAPAAVVLAGKTLEGAEMAMVDKTEKVVVTKTQKVKVSDFSGTEMPDFHWSTVTNIWCGVADIAGNKYAVFNLDLMPEEMAAFRKDLADLIQTHKNRAKARLRKS